MNRRISGKRAFDRGQGFELYLKRAMGLQGWHLIRIENGCRTIGAGGRRMKRVRQPFDYVALGPHGIDLFFDCKRRGKGKRIVPSMFTDESTKHQVQELSVVSTFKRHAGFVVMLDEIEEIFFVPVRDGQVHIYEALSWGPAFNPLKIQLPAFSDGDSV
jgi:hypothetical protein